MPTDDVIPASDLLQQHLAMIQQRASEAMSRAVRSEAETREIDTEEYAFDPQIGAFVRQREDDIE